MSGAVRLKIPSGTHAGKQRARRAVPNQAAARGLYAIVRGRADRADRARRNCSRHSPRPSSIPAATFRAEEARHEDRSDGDPLVDQHGACSLHELVEASHLPRNCTNWSSWACCAAASPGSGSAAAESSRATRECLRRCVRCAGCEDFDLDAHGISRAGTDGADREPERQLRAMRAQLPDSRALGALDAAADRGDCGSPGPTPARTATRTEASGAHRVIAPISSRSRPHAAGVHRRAGQRAAVAGHAPRAQRGVEAPSSSTAAGRPRTPARCNWQATAAEIQERWREHGHDEDHGVRAPPRALRQHHAGVIRMIGSASASGRRGAPEARMIATIEGAERTAWPTCSDASSTQERGRSRAREAAVAPPRRRVVSEVGWLMMFLTVGGMSQPAGDAGRGLYGAPEGGCVLTPESQG
jgi:hypothetical protein